METLAEAFDEDLGVGDFSYPIDVPWTDNNKKIFGFAERIQNFSGMQPKASFAITINGSTSFINNFWKCIVYNSYFPVLVSAKITMLEKIGAFTYTQGKFSASIAGSKGIFGSLVKNKKMTALKLGGNITWAGYESRKFAEDLMKGVYPEYADRIAFTPVAIENFIDTARPDFTTEFLAKDVVNNIIDTAAGADSWTFERPDTNHPLQIAVGPEHADYQTVPFLKLKYVLRQIFEEHGFSVSGDLIDDSGFDDLLLFNNYGIENYTIDFTTANFKDLNNFINPANHVPNILIIDFLKGLFSLFNVFPTFPGVNQVKLVYRKTHINKKNILSLNNIVSNQFDSTPQDAGSAGGYKLNYVWDSADQFYSDRVKVLTDKTLVATVATRGSLNTLDIGRQLTINDIAYVQADNLYYVPADATTNPVVIWDTYAEKLNEYIIGAGTRQVDCNISTLCTYVEFNTVTGLWEKRNYVGTRQPGSYQNKKNVRVVNDFGLRIFYGKKRVDISTGTNLPTSFNHNRDDQNNIIEKYSLSWDGENGLAENFHIDWQELQDRMEIVKTFIAVDTKVIADMASHNVYEINNVLFILNLTERIIPLNGGMEIWLVPL